MGSFKDNAGVIMGSERDHINILKGSHRDLDRIKIGRNVSFLRLAKYAVSYQMFSKNLLVPYLECSKKCFSRMLYFRSHTNHKY